MKNTSTIVGNEANVDYLVIFAFAVLAVLAIFMVFIGLVATIGKADELQLANNLVFALNNITMEKI